MMLRLTYFISLLSCDTNDFCCATVHVADKQLIRGNQHPFLYDDVRLRIKERETIGAIEGFLVGVGEFLNETVWRRTSYIDEVLADFITHS